MTLGLITRHYGLKAQGVVLDLATLSDCRRLRTRRVLEQGNRIARYPG